ncbi:ricin B lectin domain-containing protein [Mycena olivaceomarginata]|nr:ricin B lectin domain-containing protein [Mycena olivaceomarginata]
MTLPDIPIPINEPAMAFNRSLISLILAALSLSISAQAPDEPSTGQSLVYDTALSPGPVGGCLTASSNADGAPVIISGCFNGEASVSNTWVATNGTGIGTLQIFGDKCLDVTNGVDADGTPLQISTCVAGDASQQWISAGQIGGTPHIVWAGQNKCVNVPNGDVTAGTVLQITECDATFNDIDQNWGIAIQN